MVVGHQKHRAAVDASRERDANRVGLRTRVDPHQPLADLVGERVDSGGRSAEIFWE
jgi:hypothetical protein